MAADAACGHAKHSESWPIQHYRTNTERPNTLADLGVTLLATDKFRISNTFRVETFEIDGTALFSDFFSITRGTRTDTVALAISSDANYEVSQISEHYRRRLSVQYPLLVPSRLSLRKPSH